MTVRRPLVLVAAGCIAATTFGVVFGHGRTVALASALALAAAVAAATLLQLRPARRQQPPPRARDDDMPLRLRQIADDLRDSEQSELGVDRSLRPLLVPIVAARLGRRGVDMALAPRRAQELLGDRLWEIVRPDRPPAANRVGRGLAGDDLRAAIERLEQL
ncbi:MAG TPA: hypothetical protein VFY02_00865 [Gaiellaceae bacterium]|nr:hypothetical protein [Gaiellaceae bacterium]